MKAKVFPIPKELTALIATGFWPSNEKSANRQHLHPIVPKSSVQKFAPDETMVFFYPPPFASIQTHIDYKEFFWSDPMAAVSEVDPSCTVLIGDFGPGSDAPIALDYRKNSDEPAVIRLRWSKEGNHWVEVAPNFATFANFITSQLAPPSAG
jgi:hypothetical protein